MTHLIPLGLLLLAFWLGVSIKSALLALASFVLMVAFVLYAAWIAPMFDDHDES